MFDSINSWIASGVPIAWQTQIKFFLTKNIHCFSAASFMFFNPFLVLGKWESSLNLCVPEGEWGHVILLGVQGLHKRHSKTTAPHCTQHSTLHDVPALWCMLLSPVYSTSHEEEHSLCMLHFKLFNWDWFGQIKCVIHSHVWWGTRGRDLVWDPIIGILMICYLWW